MHTLGAAFGVAAVGVPSYTKGFNNGNDIGGLVAAVLEPTGGFGKFCLVLMALSVPAACAPTMYSFGKQLFSACFGSRILIFFFFLVFGGRYKLYGDCSVFREDTEICLCHCFGSDVSLLDFFGENAKY